MSGLFAGTPLERPVTCEHCGKPLGGDDRCACPRDASGVVRLPRDQHPRVRRERRRGNWCTVVSGLDPHATDLKALLTALRCSLGAGGGISEGPEGGSRELVIQGDHRKAILGRLLEMGYRAKIAGG